MTTGKGIPQKASLSRDSLSHTFPNPYQHQTYSASFFSQYIIYYEGFKWMGIRKLEAITKRAPKESVWMIVVCHWLKKRKKKKVVLMGFDFPQQHMYVHSIRLGTWGIIVT